MDNEKRQALSKYRMEQSEETLKAARMCLDNKLLKDCINRCYYVASGKFPRDVGKLLGRLKTVREDSDYSEFYIASVEDAVKQYEAACFVKSEIEKYLKECNIVVKL